MKWEKDILGKNFEQLTLLLDDDYEGGAVATLVHLLSSTKSSTAILYIHGFNDYFFQTEMAFHYAQSGYNFYALDLRKYGRSYLPHQKFNDIRDLKNYYEEINKAVKIIRENHNQIILMGHSTGGLILTLYAKDHTGKGLFNGLILNSPFFDFNLSPHFLKHFIPLVTCIGRIFPNLTISKVLNQKYGESLHENYDGEWNYNLEWKPNLAPPVSLGWINAIYRGQKELKKRFKIEEPVLVLHSEKSINNKKGKEEFHSMDAILSVTDIKRIALNIQGNVQISSIRGGMHDLILSSKEVREEAYRTIMVWLAKYLTKQ